MKHVSPDIAWHGQKTRILSIDFHPFTNEFATAGSQQKFASQDDKETDFYKGCVKIWRLNHQNLHHPEFQYGLSQLQSNVNVVKYSPDGRYLALANDQKQIFLFVQRETNRSFTSQQKMVRWARSNIRFCGHGQDVIDLAWSKNSQYIVSASMDGTVKFWNLSKTRDSKTIATFQKAVQGVAIHPNIEYILGVGNDQTARMIAPTTSKKARMYENWYVKKTFQKYHYRRGVLQKQDAQEQRAETFKMFANESISSFFRRPAISPDGQLFILPCGIWRSSQQDDPKCCAYLFRKNYFTKPSFSILTNKQPVLVCKFCPLLFKKKNAEQGIFKQPYYMIFAVATTNSVFIYSTESLKPLYGMGNFHYAALTDLSWRDDKVLAVSSSDGYLSFFVFQNNELGQIYIPQQGPLKQMVTKTRWIPPIKPTEMVQQVVQQQQTIKVETATGVKKKIIPKIISTHQ